MWFFPLAAAGVSAIFCASLFSRWMKARGPHLLAWTIALAMFAVASAAAALGIATEWSAAEYRVFYLFGAILNVPVLAVGTIYLLGARKVASICAVVVCLAAAIAAVVIFRADVASPALVGGGIPSGREAMTSLGRNLSRYYSFIGFGVVVGGALWSAWRLAKAPEQRMQRLARANVLIATGTFVVALASGFARYGEGAVFSVGLALGVTIMFAGFVSTRARVG
jgi:hypothetical protein